MKAKPATEIRNLKKRVRELELLCEFAGVPLLTIQIPEVVLNHEKYKLWKERYENTNVKDRKGFNASL